MIETVFYFADNKSEFEANTGNISERTITFVPTSATEGEIWKAGHKYGGVSTEEIVEKITTLIQQGEIPFATANQAGLIRLGNGLKARGADGIVDIDFENIQPTDISGLEDLIRSIVGDMIDPNDPQNPVTVDLTKLKLSMFNNTLRISYDNGVTWTNVGTVGNEGQGNTYDGHTKTTVEVNQLLNSGLPIASISVDGESATTIYAPINSGDGTGGGTTYIENPYDDSDLQNRISAVENDLADKWSLLDNKIEGEITDLLSESEWWEQNVPEGVIGGQSNFGQADVELYLQTLGMWTTVNGQRVTVWSKIQLDIDEIDLKVAAIEGGVDESDLTALKAELKEYIDSLTDTAINELSTVYARKDAEKILQWMYSGLTLGSNATQTWNELVSAANGGGSGAIANVSTNIKKLAEGDYLATANLVSAITENKGEIATTLASAGVLTSADLNNASSTLYSKLGEKYAAVDTVVTKTNGIIESNVTIKADQIDLAGETTFITAVGNALSADTAWVNNLLANRALIGEYQSKTNGIYCKIDPNATYSSIKLKSDSAEYVNISANSSNGGWFNGYNDNMYHCYIYTNGFGIEHQESTGSNSTDPLFSRLTDSTNSRISGTISDKSATFIVSDGTNSNAITGTGSIQTSDVRLKNILGNKIISAEQIADAPSFVYNPIGDNSTILVGTSAQYWQDILPETVSETNEYLGLDYSKVATISTINLAKEVVTLKQLKATLVERIEALEARLQLIENQLNAR